MFQDVTKLQMMRTITNLHTARLPRYTPPNAIHKHLNLLVGLMSILKFEL